MSNNNPHRFPRPPTLPQSKIQIQTQREQKFAGASPTFASMVGRTTNGHMTFGAADGKEEASSPGSFTTSFDLLSIAKMVPAKSKRVTNTTGISETQVMEIPTESLGVQGDWRKQVSPVMGFGGSFRSPPSETKSMVFRRAIAVPSSRLVRRSCGIPLDQTKNAQNHQPTEGDKTSSWGSEEVTIFGDKILPSTAPLLEEVSSFSGKGVDGCFETHEASQGELSPKTRPVNISNYPDPSLEPVKFNPRPEHEANSGIKDHQHVDEEAEDHDRKDSKTTLSRDGQMADANRMDLTAMFQPAKLVPTAVGQALDIPPSIELTKTSPQITPTKGVGEGAGILRAVAVPFQPKQPPNPDLEILPMIRHEGFTTAGPNFPQMGSQNTETFAHLSDNFYGKTFDPPITNPLPRLLDTRAAKWSLKEAQRKAEDIHVEPHQDQQTRKGSPERFSDFGASGDTLHKKLSLGDVGISQLWQVPTVSGDNDRTTVSQSLGLTGVNSASLNPGTHPFLTPKGNLELMLSDKNKEQETVAKETSEPAVLVPRNTPKSELQNVERLESKALALSESETETISKVLRNEAYIAPVRDFIKNQAAKTNPLPELNELVQDYLQRQSVKDKPLPKMDKLGRRGAVSMQGTTRRGLENSDMNNRKPERPTLESQRKELMGVEGKESWLKKWLEPNGVVEIRIRNEGEIIEDSGKDWLYPYPTHGESKEKVATQLVLKAYEQLLSYLVPLAPDGIKSEKDYWRFDTRKSNSDYPPGKEPWYGGDNISFFDMSFGVNPNHAIRKTTIKPPPGLSAIPIFRVKTTVGPNNIGTEELSGLRDLVEGSTPDYNDYGEEHRKVRAKTLQEWDSAPAHIYPSANAPNSRIGVAKQESSTPISWPGTFGYENAGQEANGSLRPTVFAVDREMSRNTILMQQLSSGSRFGVDMMDPKESRSNLGLTNENDWKLNGMGDMGTLIKDGNGLSEQKQRKRMLEQKQEAFGGIRKLGALVFGSDEESGG